MEVTQNIVLYQKAWHGMIESTFCASGCIIFLFTLMDNIHHLCNEAGKTIN